MNNRKLLAFTTGVALLATSAAHAVTYQATFFSTGTAGKMSLNDHGQVASGGYLYDPAKGTSVALPTLSVNNRTRAYGINNHGQVVGTALSPTNSSERQGLLTGANGVGIAASYSDKSNVSGINDSGQVIGEQMDFDQTWIQMFITGPNGVGQTFIPLPNPWASNVNAINASGQVVGNSQFTPGGDLQAFITGPNGVGVTRIGSTDPNIYSAANDLNDIGQVVGVAWNASHENRAFITDANGTGFRLLGTLGGGNYSVAYGINNGGDVVGMSRLADGSTFHGFISFDGATMVDLNTLLATSLGGGKYIRSALGINEKGQLIVRDNLNNNYLLTMVPLPASAWLMFSGLAGLFALTRKRRLR